MHFKTNTSRQKKKKKKEHCVIGPCIPILWFVAIKVAQIENPIYFLTNQEQKLTFATNCLSFWSRLAVGAT